MYSICNTCKGKGRVPYLRILSKACITCGGSGRIYQYVPSSRVREETPTPVYMHSPEFPIFTMSEDQPKVVETPAFEPGGGNFGGAGVSDSWSSPDSSSIDSTSSCDSSSSSSSDSSSSSSCDSGSSGGSSD